MRKLAVIMVLTGAFGLQAQSGLPLIQPDAGFVLGIEWRRIVDSPVGVMLTEQFQKSDKIQAPQVKGLQDAFLRGIDSVVIAAPASGLATGAKQPPMLVILKGRFDHAQIRALLAAKEQNIEKYHTVELLAAPDGTADTKIAFLDAGTILAGDRGQVCAAIDRIKSGRLAPPNNGILDGVSELATRNDLWMVIQVPANATKDAPPAMAQMFSGVRSAELGVSFQQGFAMRMNVRAKDADSANTMAQALQGLIAMAALSQNPSPQPSLDFLKKVQIAPEGSRVKLELALNQSEFEKILKDAQNTRQIAASPASPATPAARPPEPAGPKTIRISGLDSGPLEVPLSTTQK